MGYVDQGQHPHMGKMQLIIMQRAVSHTKA